MSVPIGLPPTDGPCLKCGKPVVSPDSTTATEVEAPTVASNDPDDSGKRLKPIILWGLVTGAILILGFLGILYLSDKGASKEAPKPLGAQTQEEDKLIQESWETRAFSVLQSFLEAKTGEERKNYVQGSEMFTAQLQEGLDFEKLNSKGFVPNEVHETDKARGIFGLTFRMPAAYGFSKLFFPVPTSKQRISPPETNSLNLRSTANTDLFKTKEIMISAYFKDGEQGMKLDWPVFAQSFYGLLDSFMMAGEGKTEEIFRVGIFQDRTWPHLDSEDVLSVYRIGEASEMEESYRVMIYDDEVNRKLKERFSERKVPIETATVLIEKRDGQLILKDLICWEFLGLGGE